MKVRFASSVSASTKTAVVGVFANRKLTETAKSLDKQGAGVWCARWLRRRLRERPSKRSRFWHPPGVICRGWCCWDWGMQKLDTAALERLGGAAWSALAAAQDQDAAILLDSLPGCPVPAEQVAAHLAYGAVLRSYRFDRYRTEATEKKKDKPQVATLCVVTPEATAAKTCFAPLSAVANGVFFTRDLQSEPANVLGPVEFARECRKLEKLGVGVTVVDEKDEVSWDERLTRCWPGICAWQSDGCPGMVRKSLEKGAPSCCGWEGCVF